MKKQSIFLTIIILLVFSAFLFLRYGGRILVADDDIDHLENPTIVLLMGSVGDRALGAADLFEKGEAEQILMVHSHIMGDEALQARGISIPGSAEISQDILLESEIPKEAITILPGDAESTKDEAIVVANHLNDDTSVQDLVLVTSKYHSFRSKQIFQNALEGLDVTIYSKPTPYDTFEASNWYRDRENIQAVISEYIKLVHYYLLEQFQF